ncbi:hypothetical protein [Pseudomonas sp.]|uniref:hypothetical protein n=1 Tax=Pseudomonas sp. TaxID=306 RepID=UPI0028AF096D|nr:hypothetical protein [Pseudomonas sp.]
MDTPGAAVVGSSIVSFMPHIDQARRESVMLALLMAEQSTAQAHKEGAVTDWFDYYRRQLQFYGWDALSAEQVHWPDEQRKHIRDKALAAIGQAAGERHVDAMRLAYAGLRGAPPTLLQFERSAIECGSFRLLPCAPSGGGRVDMVLCHETLTAQSSTLGFLFDEQRKTCVRAELVRFNVRLFEQQHRAKVARALAAQQSRQIHEFRLEPSP